MYSIWPKPKKGKATSTYYVLRTPGTTTHSGKPIPGAEKITGECVTLKYPRFYLFFDWNTKNQFSVGIFGNHVYFPHHISLYSNRSCIALFQLGILYDWKRYWWKPWKYLYKVKPMAERLKDMKAGK